MEKLHSKVPLRDFHEIQLSALKSALAEKEVLFREMHHRFKNNLQALISLMSLQADLVDEPKTLAILTDLQGRTRAMALVHEKLCPAGDLAFIDLGDYLQDLTANLLYIFRNRRRVALHVKVADILLNSNTALPCGMMVNELVTNALKHAFPENGSGEGEILVAVETQGDEYVLQVSDNGVGLPPELDWRQAESLGLKLVNVWATHQLQGSLELNGRDGTAFTIRFAERK